MFDDLSDLYQQVILDHCKKPRNYHELSGATRSAQGHNPLCGDQFTIYLNKHFMLRINMRFFDLMIFSS